MGVRKTIELLKIFRIPISPSLNVFTKNGSAAKEIILVKAPVIVKSPTCLKEFLVNKKFSFLNNPPILKMN
jgi:hypothetical protein